MVTRKAEIAAPAERLYYRPAEVVRLTGLGKSTVMSAIWEGRLQAHRVGKAWLIPAAALDEWIRGGDAAA